MVPVIGMVLLQFANVSLPSQVLAVDERNSLICLIRRSVFLMRVESTSSSSHLSANLEISFFNWLCDDFILRSDDCNPDGVRLSLNGDSFLHVIVSLLLAIETGDFVIGHSVPLLGSCWHCLQEADHCLIALRVKFSIISSFHLQKVCSSFFLRILRDIALDIVLEICKES